MFTKGQEVNYHELRDFVHDIIINLFSKADLNVKHERNIFNVNIGVGVNDNIATEKIIAYLIKKYELKIDYMRELTEEEKEKYRDELEGNDEICPFCRTKGYFIKTGSWHDCEGFFEDKICLMCGKGDIYKIDTYLSEEDND